MNENATTYAIDRKQEGLYGLRRFGLIALYTAIVLAFFVLIYITRVVPLFALCPLLIYILYLATWRYTQETNEYVIEVGDITFSRIFGNRTRRQILKLHIRDLKAVLPIENEPHSAYDKVYDIRSSRTSPDGYCLVFHDKNEKKCLVRFDATRKAVKLLSMYNPSAVSGKKELRY